MKRKSAAQRREKSYTDFRVAESRLLYWTTLLVMTVCNMLIAVVLIPILLAVSGIFIIGFVALIGLVFGMIFNHLINDIEHLEARHHYFATLFIPSISIIDLFATVHVAKKLAYALKIPVNQDAASLSLAFVAMFLLPYIVARKSKKRKGLFRE